MKKILIILISASTFLAGADVAVTNLSVKPDDALVSKYDLNRNGKIDVNERKPYVHELSRQRRDEAKTFAAQQPVLSPQERQFYHPPQITPDLIQKYDINHNGKLDPDERLKMSQDAADAAKADFRRFDTNQDGKLDKDEMKAAEQARRAERTRPTVAGSTTNSPTSSKDGRAVVK